jgi:hypothetical protein
MTATYSILTGDVRAMLAAPRVERGATGLTRKEQAAGQAVLFG